MNGEASDALSYVENAGPFLWPIVLCSIVALGVFLERLTFLLRLGTAERELRAQLVPLAARGDIDRAQAVCREHDGPVAHVLGTLLANLDLPPDARDQVLGAAAHKELRRMESGLRALAVIARIAPLLGLLGTVVGLVQAFVAVSTLAGPPDPSVLAGGIWQALLTTVAGLIVAIPTYLAHEGLQSRVDRIAAVIEEGIAEILAAALRAGVTHSNDNREETHGKSQTAPTAVGTR